MLIKPDVELNLNLNLGSPPRRRSISGCKCLLITYSIVLCSGVGLFFARFVTKAVANVSNPHRALYQNESLQEVSNRTSVVQLLINRDQTFDIVATVWLRSTRSRGHEVVVGREGEKEEETTEGHVEVPKLETQLFSDIIF
jgi:hypothetical protein